MKTICVMQPYIFSYLPYYQLAGAVDEFWIFDDAQFIRRGWMNRNFILLCGRKHLFTIPVSKGKREDLILEKMLPSNFNQSLQDVITTMRHAYSRAAHVQSLLSLLNTLADRPWTRFLDFVVETLRLSFQYLGIETPLYFTSSLGLQREVCGVERILAICEQAGANHYINLIGGTPLYNVETFANQDVRLSFLHGECRAYHQTGTAEFEPGLSILDLIANLEPTDCINQLRNYKLIG